MAEDVRRRTGLNCLSAWEVVGSWMVFPSNRGREVQVSIAFRLGKWLVAKEAIVEGLGVVVAVSIAFRLGKWLVGSNRCRWVAHPPTSQLPFGLGSGW